MNVGFFGSFVLIFSTVHASPQGSAFLQRYLVQKINETEDKSWPWSGGNFGCAPATPSTKFPALPKTLIFSHVPKTGGTTMDGVVRRIGCKCGRWQQDIFSKTFKTPDDLKKTASCRPAGMYLHWHTNMVDLPPVMKQCNEHKIAMIRDPLDRCMSAAYFFSIRRNNAADIEGAKLNVLKSCQNYQMKFLRAFPSESVDSVVKRHDFIGITSRYDEGLVVLAHLWKRPLTDMLYLMAKSSKKPSVNTFNRSIPMVPHTGFEHESQKIKSYGNNVFPTHNSLDYKLVAQVNKRLDSRIATIPDFQAKFAKFKFMLSTIEKTCRPRITEGCFIKDLSDDAGCGQFCINMLVSKFNW